MAFRDPAAAGFRKSLREGRDQPFAARGFNRGLLALACALAVAVCALLIDRRQCLDALLHVGRALETLTRVIASVEAPF